MFKNTFYVLIVPLSGSNVKQKDNRLRKILYAVLRMLRLYNQFFKNSLYKELFLVIAHIKRKRCPVNGCMSEKTRNI